MNLSEGMKKKLMEKPCIQQFMAALENEVRTNCDFDMCRKTMLDYTYQIYLMYKQLNKPYDSKLTIDEAYNWKDEYKEQYGRKTMGAKIAAINQYLSLVCGYNGKKLKIKNIKRDKNPTVLSYERIMEIVQYWQSKQKYTNAMLVYVDFWTTCRYDVLHRIKISDMELDTQKKTIKLTKTKGDKDHTVPISDEVTQKIKEYIENQRPTPQIGHEDYLIPKKDGTKVHPAKISQALKIAAKHMNIQESVHCHTMRTSFIMWAESEGWTDAEIIEVTGHASAATIHESYTVLGNVDQVYDKLNKRDKPKKKTQENPKEPKPKPMPAPKSDIDKLLELERLKYENLKKENENLKLQAGLYPTHNAPENPVGYS